MENFSFISLHEAPSIILKIKPTILGDHLEGWDGEGTQEDEDSQVLGLRQQHGYDEWKHKQKETVCREVHTPGLVTLWQHLTDIPESRFPSLHTSTELANDALLLRDTGCLPLF